MRKIMAAGLLIGALLATGCAPVTLQKCHKDFKYDANGKMISEYTECLTQTPEKMLPIHLKHQELYE